MYLFDQIRTILSAPLSSSDGDQGSHEVSNAEPRRLMFLTHAESGQAGVHLAVIHALRVAHPDSLELHLGSFGVFRPRVPDGVAFHALEGVSMRETGIWVDRLHAAQHNVPGLDHTISRAEILIPTLVPYSAEEYISTAKDVERIIQQVQPDLVVIDTLFQQAIDAVWRLGVKHCLLSTNTAKDVALKELGICAANYPMIATGLDYPLPWSTFFRNAWAGVQMEQHIATRCPHTQTLNAARQAAGYNWPLPLPNPRPETLTLCVSPPNFDYPMKLPSHIRQCGPILRPAASVDREIGAWLARHGMKTVLVAFGTHFRVDEPYAKSIYSGLAAILAVRGDLQVLWKLAKYGQYCLPDMSRWGDRLRVVEWLESEPVDIMRTGKVVALVHHGGSNSYHEALATGVPQVIASAWLDCHDFGPRAEYLGVGIWANRKAAPAVDADEFTDAMRMVLLHEHIAPKVAQRAKDVQIGIHAGWLKQSGSGKALEGRDVAAQAIWEYASGRG